MDKILNFVQKLLVSCYFLLRKKPVNLVYLIKNKELYKHKTYFPECGDRRKSTRKIFWEQVCNVLKYNTADYFYFPYGLDVKPKEECKKYLHYNYHNIQRDKLNFASKVNCTCILRDKMLFNIFANGIGISTPSNVLYASNGKLYDFQNKKEVFPVDLCKYAKNTLFCKLVDGECGKGIFKLEHDGTGFVLDGQKCDEKTAYQSLTRGRYLAQEVVKQHPDMALLHPQSVNSMRIVTVRSVNDGVIRVWPSILRMGTGNNIVDNTSQGGVYAGIDFDTCRLKKWGFYKPQFGLKTDRHPDSNIIFTEFTIPYLKEACEQAKYFHSMLPGMQSVGWDIAIGENGPIFIEGNDNWEINGPQICNGGLRDLYEEQFVINKK